MPAAGQFVGQYFLITNTTLSFAFRLPLLPFSSLQRAPFFSEKFTLSAEEEPTFTGISGSFSKSAWHRGCAIQLTHAHPCRRSTLRVPQDLHLTVLANFSVLPNEPYSSHLERSLYA
ncbi:MAG TPA: hypothetical protein DGH68_12165 [Bacteroidetes bacterium]|jgi:hypothetical protein|nr:hypothetical protein [Bacteroidota bacterium]